MDKYEVLDLELIRFQSRKILGEKVEHLSINEIKSELDHNIFKKIKEYAEAQSNVRRHFDDTYKNKPFNHDESLERFRLQDIAETKLLDLLESLKSIPK